MDIGGILGVVIGLVTMYWIVATASSFVVETIASMGEVRARALEVFVQQMLTGAPIASVLALVRQASSADRPDADAASAGQVTPTQIDVADHPMIRRLYKPAAFLSGEDTAPSYIPAEMFAKALLDRLTQLFGALAIGADVLRAVQEHLSDAERAVVAGPLRDALAELDTVAAWQAVVDRLQAAGGGPAAVLSAIAPRLNGTQRAVVEEVVSRLNAMAPAVPANFAAAAWPTLVAIAGSRAMTVADVRAIIDSGRLPASLAAALRPAVDAANHDIDALRKGIESWYDNVMDRATGWFRRWAQVWLFVAAGVIAVAFNLDTLHVAKQLKNDPAAREAAVQLGSRIASNGAEAPTLAQQAIFRRTFDDGTWGERMENRDYQAVAMRAQPLLLKSGALVGPMLALQAVALQAGAAKCAEDPTSCPDGWKAALDTVVGAMCRARLSLPDARPVDREWAAQRSDLQIAAAGPADRSDPCVNVRELVEKMPVAPQEKMEKLWSSTELVWNPKLAVSAWRVRREPTPDHLTDFSSDMVVAIQKAHDELAAVDALAARLEGVGSLKFAYERWGKTTGCVGFLLSLVGWFITAFMASLGAPLWFDLLTKLTNRRIAGPKPATATSEG